jgi:lysyl-tRNA synthetase class I
VTAPPLDPVVIPESTRDIKEILAERVTVLPGSIGLRIADNTPIEESLRVLDWTTTLSNHVGFMIGDVLNHAYFKWGEKYQAALSQTGRALPTLKQYCDVASKIPPNKRVAALTFTHHAEILRIGNDTKVEEVLKEVGAQAEKGHAPTTSQVRERVRKLKPKKPKKAKSMVNHTKSKKKKAKPEPPPYEPSADEQAKLDSTEDKARELADEIKSGGLFKIAAKLDNTEKLRWIAMFEPFVMFYNNLDRLTGY